MWGDSKVDHCRLAGIWARGFCDKEWIGGTNEVFRETTEY